MFVTFLNEMSGLDTTNAGDWSISNTLWSISYVSKQKKTNATSEYLFTDQ